MCELPGSRPYDVIYNFGYGDRPRRVYARNEAEAASLGLSEFRRHACSVETLDFSTLEQVVKEVVPVDI